MTSAPVMYRYIRGEAERSSCVKRDVGNVMIDTEITFEYGIHTTKSRDHRGIVCVSVEFYLYPTVSTALIHSVKPELTE